MRNQEPVGGAPLHRPHPVLIRALSRCSASRAGLDREGRRRLRRQDHRARRAPRPPEQTRPASVVPDRRTGRLALQARDASLSVEARNPSLPRGTAGSSLLQAGALVRGCARADRAQGRGGQGRTVEDLQLFDRIVVVEGGRTLLRAPSGDRAGVGRFRRLPVRRQAGERGLLAQGPHARHAPPPYGGLAPRTAQEPEHRRRRLGRQPAARHRLRDRQRSPPRNLALPADQDRQRTVSRGPAHASLRRRLQVCLRERLDLDLVAHLRIPDRSCQSRRDHGGDARTAASCSAAALPTACPTPTRSRW